MSQQQQQNEKHPRRVTLRNLPRTAGAGCANGTVIFLSPWRESTHRRVSSIEFSLK